MALVRYLVSTLEEYPCLNSFLSQNLFLIYSVLSWIVSPLNQFLQNMQWLKHKILTFQTLYNLTVKEIIKKAWNSLTVVSSLE